VPILGTALGVLIFLLAGLLTHDTLWQALLPAGLYFGFPLIEGETLTPMLLARRVRGETILGAQIGKRRDTSQIATDIIDYV
jgi:predicted PurR-regulated permease PerM